MAAPFAFHGTLIHSRSLRETEILENAIIFVSDGAISALERDVLPSQVPHRLKELGIDVNIRYLSRHEFIIPGFVDTHNHAPQWAQRGLGQSMHILNWLEQVTFPNEAKFGDPEYARRIYTSCVEGFLKQGVTTASYYGSLHVEATKILADICLEKGQRALVGKCNMNRNAPDYYRDATVESSLHDTEECIRHVREIDPQAKILQYVLTPRFAITCDDALLEGLGKIARENPTLAIQTHFNEAEQEISFTKTLFPQYGNEVNLYDHFGLLTSRSILAHCCFMSDWEMARIKTLECGVAHCPVSNMTVGGGFMAAPIRQLLRWKVKVGLGTDSGGGFSSSMLDVMRQALIASNAREVMSRGQDKGLNISELLYLATLGGAEVCCLEDKIGNFEIGKDFDALLVNTEQQGGIMTMMEEGDSVRTMFDKFIMTGDDRNIQEVFVRGRSVKGTS